MSALSIQVPFPVFAGTNGQPLENGYIWIGVVNLNPQVNPIAVYWDAALTIPAAQPLRTLNGYVSRSGTPAQVYINGVNFSILVQDSKGSMVYNFPDGSGISSNASGIVYDPITGPATTVQAELQSLDAAIVTLTAADTTFALKGANTDITSLASPALGDATATTQSPGDNTTKVATTAFVIANPAGGLGYGQTWQIVARTAGTNYTNSTGKPIVLQISAFCTTGSNIAIFCAGLTLATYQGATASPIYGTISVIVPNGNIYGYTSTGAPTSLNIFELR